MYENEYGEQFITGDYINEIVSSKRKSFSLVIFASIFFTLFWLFAVDSPSTTHTSVFIVLLFSHVALESVIYTLLKTIDSVADVDSEDEFLFLSVNETNYIPILAGVFVIGSLYVIFFSDVPNVYIVFMGQLYLIFTSYTKFLHVGKVYETVIEDDE